MWPLMVSYGQEPGSRGILATAELPVSTVPGFRKSRCRLRRAAKAEALPALPHLVGSLEARHLIQRERCGCPSIGTSTLTSASLEGSSGKLACLACLPD